MRLKITYAVLALACGCSSRADEFATNHYGTVYHGYVCRPDQVVITWADTNGVPLRTFLATERYLRRKHIVPAFMMNGGIFNEGGIPSGLLVENGQVVRPLNLSNGTGNFYLKPNGVFFIAASGAAIVESQRYSTMTRRPQFAIQSGPLLLLDGLPHPDLRPASSNRLHRNGVGIMPDGSVLFAITEQFQERLPNLYEFAQFFASRGCQSALFLDGDLSQWVMYPTTNAIPGNHFGAVISVRQEAQPPARPYGSPTAGSPSGQP